MSHPPQIFVHIASYRDRECQWTVRDLFSKARHPERIFVGICWQTIPELDADCFLIETRPSQVRSVHFHAEETQGLGWARQQSQSLWQGEPYSLQIDSHMRFVQDWDQVMLDMLAACDSPDPVLTVYPPGYTPPDRLIDNERPTIQYVKGFLPNGLLDFSAAEVPADQCIERPMPTAACAGGFIFAPSRMLQDVPPDPEIYFNGEEPNLAVRLWTAGFDLFSPSRTVIYHYYRRKDSSRHWNDATDWIERHRLTLRRMQALCNPASCTSEEVASLGRYGLGSRRSLAEYQAFSGVDFAGRTLADYARVYPYVRQAARDEPAKLPDEELVPVADAHVFLLGDEGLVFRQQPGEFYRLNDSAAFVWCARQEGWSWSRIASEQSAARNVTPAIATAEIANLAAHWLGQGLLCRAGEDPPPVPGSRRHGPCLDGEHFKFIEHIYELLGSRMRVRYSEPALEHRIHPLLAHLGVEGSGSAQINYTVARILDQFYLFKGGHMLHCGDNPAALAPLLKFQMSARAIGQQDAMVQIHAGAVECHGCLVLLPGQAGHGKTTMTARLVAAGGTFFSDEVVLLERDRRGVRPVPMSLCVKAKGLALLQPWFPELPALPVHLREDGIEVRYLPPPPGSVPPPDHSAEPRLLVLRRYFPGARQALRKLSPTEAFGLLMDNCVAIPKPLELTDAMALAGLIKRLDCYELTGSDLDQDAETVLDLCRRFGALETAESGEAEALAVA
jgi:hypothetical protein